MNTATRRILIVDDSAADREYYRQLLERDTNYIYTFQECETSRKALELARDMLPDCILLDYYLPGATGVEFLREVADISGATIPVVMLTGQGSESIAVEAMRHGAQDYLVKDQLSVESLSHAIDNAIEKRSLQCKLQESYKALEAKSNRLAEMYDTAHQFVDHVSHEFRTPLSVIKEFTAIIRDGLAGETTDTQYEYLGIIAQRVEDLCRLVDDMLDMSKLEAGLLRIRRQPCELKQIIADLVPSLKRHAASIRAELEVANIDDMPTLFCDGEKIGRVISNLVVNALKFCGDPGRVYLSAELADSGRAVKIAISDNGKGISPEAVETIFERFHQVGGASRRGIKGFGLGLSIVKELVQLNFGEINVESEVGAGSTFSFTVPVNDRACILDAYLQAVQRQSDRGPLINVLGISVEDGHPENILRDIQDFIQAQLRRSDLLLRQTDNHWILIGANNRPDLEPLEVRLQGALEQENEHRFGIPLPPLTFSEITSTGLSTPPEDLLEYMQPQLAAGGTHG